VTCYWQKSSFQCVVHSFLWWWWWWWYAVIITKCISWDLTGSVQIERMENENALLKQFLCSKCYQMLFQETELLYEKYRPTARALSYRIFSTSNKWVFCRICEYFWNDIFLFYYYLLLIVLGHDKVIQYFDHYSTAYLSSSEPIPVNGNKLWPGHLVGGSYAISSAALNPSAGWVIAPLKAATPLSKSDISVHHLVHS
jgi:hypothetical protein